MGNLFETLVTLISKWPGISKIYPPIVDYRMVCVLSNNLSVFDSSQGTPCIIFLKIDQLFLATSSSFESFLTKYLPTYISAYLLSLALLSSSLFSFFIYFLSITYFFSISPNFIFCIICPLEFQLTLFPSNPI